jgi:hypothetical protein
MPAVIARDINDDFPCNGGFIRADYNRFNLDAHCTYIGHSNPGNPCRMSRTMLIGSGNSANGRAKGRPVGKHLAWLEDASRHITRNEHVRAGLCVLARDKEAMSFAIRKDCRRRHKDTHGPGGVFGLERKFRWLDEDSEPEGFS